MFHRQFRSHFIKAIAGLISVGLVLFIGACTNTVEDDSLGDQVLSDGTCAKFDSLDEYHFRVLYPNGGEKLFAGDTVTFRYCSEDPEQYLLGNSGHEISFDGGEKWISLVFLDPTESPQARWVVPDTIDDFFRKRSVPTQSKNCLYKIIGYDLGGIDFDISDKVFEIGKR